MSWSLKGSYFETCSCDLMCPCNMSFDHGATYDYCRVTLVFNIKEGEIEGTDVSGLKVAAIADSPKVMTEGNWRLGLFVDEDATDEQMEKLTAVFGGQKGGPMEAVAPLVGEMLGVERAPFEVVEDGLQPQRQDRRRDRLRDRGHRPLRRRDGAAGPARRRVPSGLVGVQRRRGEALEDQRLRDRVRGEDRDLGFRVRLGRLSIGPRLGAKPAHRKPPRREGHATGGPRLGRPVASGCCGGICVAVPPRRRRRRRR